jgi:hypothetical protein
MRPKNLTGLIIAGNFVVTSMTSVSQAQFAVNANANAGFSMNVPAYNPGWNPAMGAQYGTGVWAGNQPCPYPNGPADGAEDEMDEVSELTLNRAEARVEKRRLEKEIRKAEADRDKIKDSITKVVQKRWTDVMFEHMDRGMDCCTYLPPKAEAPPLTTAPPQTMTVTAPSPVAQPPPSAEPTQDVSPGGPREDPAPAQTAPVKAPVVIPKPLPKLPNGTGIKNKDVLPPLAPAKPRAPGAALDRHSDRMPASVHEGDSHHKVSASRAPASEAAVDVWADLDNSAPVSSDVGANRLCYPSEKPYNHARWQPNLCLPDGFISSRACTDRFYQNSVKIKTSEVSTCSHSVERYRKMTKEIDKLRKDVEKVETELSDIDARLPEAKREAREDALEAQRCPACYEKRMDARRSGRVQGSGRSIAPLAIGVGAGLLAEYLGYRSNKEANIDLKEAGWKAQPYHAGEYGMGLAMAGVYGYLGGGLRGGFGCNTAMNGPSGPFYNPYAQNPYAQQVNPWGSMYMPGQGPWGQAGPWNTAQQQQQQWNPFAQQQQQQQQYWNPQATFNPFAQNPAWPGGFPGMPGQSAFPGSGFLTPFQNINTGLNTGQDLQQQQQQLQLYMEMQRRQSDADIAATRAKSTLMTQYYELMFKFNQVNSGFLGAGGLGLDSNNFYSLTNSGSNTFPGTIVPGTNTTINNGTIAPVRGR